MIINFESTIFFVSSPLLLVIIFVNLRCIFSSSYLKYTVLFKILSLMPAYYFVSAILVVRPILPFTVDF